ncbi:hypothetical protein [Paraburkholderia dinghuensis]|uniref:Uncharacterized protein n=1 Tax=Paraburkholderia dinghuensis TaxID=2305225 RepID=A0A3N6MEB9_9BURK|nr:hypothetical protein [Paraburkholderia dinghuensis]RQH02229.1 hypothetical protein D1Y85_22395 [Paraburkholderia dinghuensis]
MIRFSAGLLVISASVAAAHAQSVLAPATSAPTPRNPLVLAAGNVGVRQCLPALSALSEFGVRDARNSDVLLDWDHRKPNGAAVFSLLGLEGRAGSNAVMSISAVPELDGSCSTSAERIEVAPKSCKAVADAELRGFQATKLLPQMTVYAKQQDPGSTVSLIETSGSCLVIRRFVKFAATWTAAGAVGPGK